MFIKINSSIKLNPENSFKNMRIKDQTFHLSLELNEGTFINEHLVCVLVTIMINLLAIFFGNGERCKNST